MLSQLIKNKDIFISINKKICNTQNNIHNESIKEQLRKGIDNVLVILLILSSFFLSAFVVENLNIDSTGLDVLLFFSVALSPIAILGGFIKKLSNYYQNKFTKNKERSFFIFFKKIYDKVDFFPYKYNLKRYKTIMIH